MHGIPDVVPSVNSSQCASAEFKDFEHDQGWTCCARITNFPQTNRWRKQNGGRRRLKTWWKKIKNGMVTIQFTTKVWQHTTGGSRIITIPTADCSAAKRETANFTPHSFILEVASRVRSQRSKRNYILTDKPRYCLNCRQGKMSRCKKEGPGCRQLYYAAMDLVSWGTKSTSTNWFPVCNALYYKVYQSFVHVLSPFLLLHPSYHQQEGPPHASLVLLMASTCFSHWWSGSRDLQRVTDIT